MSAASAASGPQDAALARFRERVGVMVEQALAGYWRRVIADETELLVRQGPAAYLAYIDRLNYASVTADLDVELRGILDGGTS